MTYWFNLVRGSTADKSNSPIVGPKLKTCAAIAVALAVGLKLAAASASEPIGYASSLRPSASQVPPGESSREIAWKDRIFRNAELTTSEKGALEVTFDDQSKLSMGPNSEMKVDQFVYSGSQGSGEQVLKYTKGAFRFISGSVAKDKVKLETPTATIGIRGTIVRTLVTNDGSTTVGVDHGTIFITSFLTGQTIQLNAGQKLTIQPTGSFGTITLGKVEGCD